MVLIVFTFYYIYQNICGGLDWFVIMPVMAALDHNDGIRYCDDDDGVIMMMMLAIMMMMSIMMSVVKSMVQASLNYRKLGRGFREREKMKRPNSNISYFVANLGFDAIYAFF